MTLDPHTLIEAILFILLLCAFAAQGNTTQKLLLAESKTSETLNALEVFGIIARNLAENDLKLLKRIEEQSLNFIQKDDCN